MYMAPQMTEQTDMLLSNREQSLEKNEQREPNVAHAVQC